jgi:hypothetical protein
MRFGLIILRQSRAANYFARLTDRFGEIPPSGLCRQQKVTMFRCPARRNSVVGQIETPENGIW